jgi:uncharacterized protein
MRRTKTKIERLTQHSDTPTLHHSNAPFDAQVNMKNYIVKVYLQPKSSKNEIVGPYRDGIKVKVTAPPVEGKANEALIRFLAKELDVSPSSIEILKGHHSKEKTLRISGGLNQELVKKLQIVTRFS